MSSFRKRTFQGEFWPSAAPSLKGQGGLSIDEFGQAKLSISGAAGIDKGFARGAIDYTVHGVISAGYPYRVSLFHCFAHKAENPFVATGVGFSAEITCRTVLIGEHIDDTDEKAFVGAEFSTTGLALWNDMGGFVGRSMNSGKSRTIRQRNRATRPVQLADKSSISFETKYDGPLSLVKTKSVTLKETDIINIRMPTVDSLDEILRRVVLWQSFIGFATRSASYVDDIRVEMTDAAKAIWIVPRSGSDPIRRSGLLLSRKDLSIDLSRYLNAWNNNYANLEPVISLFVGISYQTRLYPSLQFLSFVQALETFHRRTRKGEFQSHEEFKAHILNKLKAAVPDRINSDYRERIVAGMTHLNEWSLIQRLCDLYDRDFNAVSKLFPDRSKDMRLVRDVRNYLTHYEGKRAKMAKYLVSREFIMLTLKLKLFVEICLLRSLRMKSARVRKIMRQLGEFQWLSSENHNL